MTVEKTLKSIEKRLTRIESELGIDKASMAAAKAAAKPAKTTAKQSAVGQIHLPELGSEKWLAIVATICFVFAGAFIIKLSIDSGWLTPSRQMGLAGLFGVGLIAAGFTFMRADRPYASFLPAAGIIVLYLTSFATHRLHHLLTFESALLLTGVISLFCIGLYRKIQHDIYAIAAATGAYLAIFILAKRADVEFVLFYALLCSVGFSVISVWIETRIVTIISAYLAILVTFLYGDENINPATTAIFMALNFGVLSLGTYLFSYHRQRPLSGDEAWGFLPVLLLFYFAEYALLSQAIPVYAPWLSLGFAGFILGLYFSAKRFFNAPLESGGAITLFVTLVCTHAVYIELLPPNARPWLLVLSLFAAAFLIRRPKASALNSNAFIPLFALFMILIVEYFMVLCNLLVGWHDHDLIIATAAILGFWLVILRAGNENVLLRSYSGAEVLLIAAHLLAISGLYRLNVDVGSLAVSASWLGYAVAVMGFAYYRKDPLMLRSAIIILGVAAAKALLYDAANAATIIRIACLFLTGCVLYGCGFLIRRASSWKES